MVMADERSYGSQGGVLRDHIGADIRMATHNFPLFFAKGSRLIKDVIAHTDLPQVMQRSGCTDQFDIPHPQFEMFTKPAGKFCDPNRVRLGIAISCVKSLGG